MSHFVSITRLRVRSIRFLPGFGLRAFRSMEQARRALGFEDGALLAERRRTFWTMTVWDRLESMRAFMTSGDHAAVMPRLLDWCDEASVAHWEQDTSSRLPWLEVDLRMRADGRPSKLRRPSPDHAAMTFASPGRGAEQPIRPARRAPS